MYMAFFLMVWLNVHLEILHGQHFSFSLITSVLLTFIDEFQTLERRPDKLFSEGRGHSQLDVSAN